MTNSLKTLVLREIAELKEIIETLGDVAEKGQKLLGLSESEVAACKQNCAKKLQTLEVFSHVIERAEKPVILQRILLGVKAIRQSVLGPGFGPS